MVFDNRVLFAYNEYESKNLWQDINQYDTILLVRLEQCRDSLVVVFPETERKTFASDANILSISKRLIRQNKKTYEVLANQVNPR